MKFMIILKGNEKIERSKLPTEEMLTEMNKFNEELVDAGVMVGGEGLQPASKGATVTFKHGKPIVTEGATPGTIAGFWLWKVRSLNEAIDWVKRIPNAGDDPDGVIEIRQVFEAADLGENMPPELQKQEQRLREKIANQNAKAASAQ